MATFSDMLVVGVAAEDAFKENYTMPLLKPITDYYRAYSAITAHCA